MTNKALIWILLILIAFPVHAANEVNPSAIGWGNLLVPGLGATLRGYPSRGIAEAFAEIGLFYGGTFGVREGSFTIDTTIVIPRKNGISRPLIGQGLQQIGLKIHMYNTFYHYQQASLAVSDTEREQLNPQPLYKGDWTDVLSAPFRLKNLGTPWVYGMLIAAAGYLVYDYHTSSVSPSVYKSNSGENALYLLNNTLIEPLGSAFGEEPLFRGMIQREARLYTGSLVLSLLMQSTIFTLLHPSDAKVPAFIGGLYFGFLTEHFEGDIEKAVAAHFWVNVISGLTSYLRFRRAQGDNTILAPPLGITLGFRL